MSESLSQYGDFASMQIRAVELKTEHDEECLDCPKCGSQWFTEKPCFKFLKNHQVVVGQATPTKAGAVPEFILECMRCGFRLEPAIIPSARDIASNQHDHFLDTIEGKYDTRPEEIEKREKGLAEKRARDPMTTEAGPRLSLPPLKRPQGVMPRDMGTSLDPKIPKP